LTQSGPTQSDPKKFEVVVPDTKEGRETAIEGFFADEYRLLGAGRYDDAVQLSVAWHEALEGDAPDDRLALGEVRAAGGWALHLTNDEHAAERSLTFAYFDGVQELERLSKEPGDPSGNSKAVARAQRLIGISANYLGVFHTEVTGDLQKAQSYLEDAVKRLPEDPRLVLVHVQALGNLARVFQKLGDAAKARELYLEALDPLDTIPELNGVYERFLCRQSLARVERDLGNEDACEAGLREAFDLARSMVPGDSPELAAVQYELATGLAVWGSPFEAEIHVRQSYAMYARTLGDSSHVLGEPAVLLGWLLLSRGELDEASFFLGKGGMLVDVSLRHHLEIGTEELRVIKGAQERNALDVCLSAAWHHPEHSGLAEAAADAVLRRKSLAMHILAEQRRTQRVHESETVRSLLSALDADKEQLGHALVSGASKDSVADLVAEVRRREELIGLLSRLEFKTDDREERLAAGLAERAGVLRQWGNASAEMPRTVPADAALVEYVRFTLLPQRPWEEAPRVSNYLALVWRGGVDSPQLVRLGEAEPIDRLVDELQNALDADGAALEEGREVRFSGSNTAILAGRLRRFVLDGVLVAAGDAKRLFLAPDSNLQAVPFAILPIAEGHLIDRYELTYLTSGQDLLRVPLPASDTLDPPLVVADPDYDAFAGETANAERFERMSGTRKEGIEIARLLGIEPVMDDAATEIRVRSAHSPSILHVATHGWYLQQVGKTTDEPEWLEHPRLARLKDPGFLHTFAARSGLVLAGFNSVWAGKLVPPEFGDGLLTAGEVAAMDLQGTELAVLSACDTGLGSVVDLEGVYGLGRSLLMAGARAVITAMWKVPDAPSQEIMLGLYRRLIAGVPRGAALRDAQLAARSDGRHPYLWGAFVLHGNPDKIRQSAFEDLLKRSPQAESIDIKRLPAVVALRRNDYDALVVAAAKLAEGGDALSALNMGLAHQLKGDPKAAESWYAMAANGGLGVASLALGMAHHGRGEVPEAEKWWRLAISQGNDDASQALAASLIRRGEGGEARRIWQAGADRGHRDCVYAIANEASAAGENQRAVEYWMRTADMGDWRAAEQLATLAQQEGRDGDADTWWQRAAELGAEGPATSLAAVAYKDGRIEEAIGMWRAAAALGSSEAAHNLGVALDEREDPDAEKWYRAAADAGYPQSANNMATLLLERGDMAGALRYYQIAAENGHPKAPGILGNLLLERGEDDHAVRWLRPAAETGNADAAEGLSTWYERQGDQTQAAAWLESAGSHGSPIALHRLGLQAYNRRDSDAAAELWLRAAQAGNADSAESIAQMLDASGEAEKAEEWWAGAAGAGVESAAVTLAGRYIKRGDAEGAVAVLGPAVSAGGEAARAFLHLLTSDEKVLEQRARRGHLQPILGLLTLASMREDEVAAGRWMAAAAELGEPTLLVPAGRSAMQQNNIKDAERWLLAAVASGQADAAIALAEMYRGRGDRKVETKWNSRATKLAEASSSLMAGIEAQKGGDLKTAERNWRSSAHEGIPEAAARLANVLLERKDPESAKWAEVAAAGGEPGPANSLAMAFADAGLHDKANVWIRVALDACRGR
jgi:CHAT domain-containing protein/TPR repeat protein